MNPFSALWRWLTGHDAGEEPADDAPASGEAPSSGAPGATGAAADGEEDDGLLPWPGTGKGKAAKKEPGDGHRDSRRLNPRHVPIQKGEPDEEAYTAYGGDEDDEDFDEDVDASGHRRRRLGPRYLPFNPSSIFVRRPVATTLLTIALAFSGAVAYHLLPVAPLPQMDFPVVVVRASLPGAGPETMAATVATPLERAIGTISGITELTSQSSLGSTNVIIQFEQSRDVDGAARDVQAAINAARSLLPDLPSNPTYRKINPAGIPILIITLTSETLSADQLYDLAESVLAQKIAQVPGVGEVSLGGAALPSIRVDVNPAALHRSGLSMEDVRTAIGEASVYRPRGFLSNDRHYWIVGINDQLETIAAYEDLVISYKDGAPIRLGDIAQVSRGPQDTRSSAFANSSPGTLLMIHKATGANIIETVDRIKALLPSMRKWVTSDVTIDVSMDKSTTIRASLLEVEKALVLSVALVILVVFLFLKNARATTIPAVAAPVSLVGTFGVMYLCGYSLDNLSLMALTIATGFVVDDAIVVLENIVRRMELGETPLRAALNGSREVVFTIVSMSLSLVAVFIPILCMPGTLGSLFREFAVVLATAVLISMVVSLTTTPMMCATMLRPFHGREAAPAKEGALARATARLTAGWSRFLDRVRDAYTATLAVVVRHRALTVLVFFLVLAGNVWLYATINKGFFPQQDTGMIMGGIRMDQSLSYQASTQKLLRIQSILLADPAVDKVSSFIRSGRGSSGIFISLKPLAERRIGCQQVIDRLRPKMMGEPGVQVFMQAAQDLMMGGRSSRSQYQYTLQGDDIDELRTWGNRMRDELAKSDVLKDVDSDLEEKGLETQVTVDRDLMARLGVSMQSVDNALGLGFGQTEVGTIYRDRNQYKIVLEYAEPWLQSEKALDEVRVPGSEGLVPLRAFATIGTGFSALSISHQGQFAAVTISFNLPAGTSLSTAKDIIDETAVRLGMPSTIFGSFQGTAKMYTDTVQTEIILVIAAILVLYIVLGILYESLIHPLTILSTLPPAGGGAVLALMLCGLEFSVIALIGVLLLCGLVKKNAILMIDVALIEEREHRRPPVEAILEACRLRFRPIMMTTFAAMFGAVPLAMGQGDGAELRQPLGIAIVGGLAVSQLLTLYTTPVIFLCLDSLRKFLRRTFLTWRFGERKARLLLLLAKPT